MKKKTIWRVGTSDDEKAAVLSRDWQVSPTMAKILWSRGFRSSQEVWRFLHVKKEDLRPPLELPGMKEGVERVWQAVEKGERILVYGDYDVDGITSTALLVDLLRRLGAEVCYYLPARLEEGYGLNKQAIIQARDRGIDLLLSVDCGISSVEEAQCAADLGMSVVITDHHQPPAVLPQAAALINPKLAVGVLPWSELAGVGVTFKLAQALLDKCGHPAWADDYLDLVALGTIADIVPLRGENRILVKEGLLRLHKCVRPGLNALIEASGLLQCSLTAGQVGYILAPRLNACGRLGKADLGVELLLSQDPAWAKEAALFMDKENRTRQSLEAEILAQAVALVEEGNDLDKSRVIVLASSGWHPGVIGIVASRLVEKYFRPVVMISLEDGRGKGSARSIPGFNLYEALKKNEDLFLSFGGHEMAAGMSLLEENIPALKEGLNKLALAQLEESDLVPTLRADCEVSWQELTPDLVEEIAMLAPFGYHNPSPILVLRGKRLDRCKGVGAGGNHLKLRVIDNNNWLDAIAFQKGAYKELAAAWDRCDLAFTPEINNYNGRSSLQLVIKDLKPSTERDNPFLPETFLERLYQEGEIWLEDDYSRDVINNEEFYTKVVGVTFEGRQDTIRQMQATDRVELRREPDCPYDSYAIGVYWQGIRIGYLNAKLARMLAPVIDRGAEYEAYVTRITGYEHGQLGVNLCVRGNEKKHDPADLESIRTRLKEQGIREIEEKIREAVLGGYDYHPKQKEALKRLQGGVNSLAIFATGRGKSAIFQTMSAYLALVKNQVTIIVYPLRSLVNDQHQHLKSKLECLGLTVEAVTGSLSMEGKKEFFIRLLQGSVDIILTTPEFLTCHLAKFDCIAGRLGLFVVDEAHHLARGKRHGYRQLSKTWRKLGEPLVLAVTATADDDVTQRIVDMLSVEEVIIEDYVRGNLCLVDRREEKDKLAYLTRLIAAKERVVVYVNSRRQAYQLASDLRLYFPPAKGEIGFYHGGLHGEYRKTLEEMFRKGDLRVMVTTSAFGEGIDIPDIKHVVLYHLNFSRTEFNQLAGRAGRNNEEAFIHMLFGKKDKSLNELILEGSAPTREMLGKVYLYLRQLAKTANPLQLSNVEMKEAMQLGGLKNFREQTASACLAILEELGLILREIEGNKRYIHFVPPPPGKLNLMDSVRFLEGVDEWEEFRDFADFALTENSESLLSAINKPLFPANFLRGNASDDGGETGA